MAELDQLIEQCTAEEREQILRAAYYVAFADGRFWRAKPLLDRIRRELRIPAKTSRRHTYLVWFHEWRNRSLRLTVPERQAARQLTYHYALAVAARDGKLSGSEREIAEMLGDHLGMVERAVAAELDASVPAEEPKPRRRRRSRRKRLQDVKPDNYRAMLAGLVSEGPGARSPLLAHFTRPWVMGAAALVVMVLLWVVFSDSQTPQKDERPTEAPETPEADQPVDDASKPELEAPRRPEPERPMQLEAPLELGLLDRKVDGPPSVQAQRTGASSALPYGGGAQAAS